MSESANMRRGRKSTTELRIVDAAQRLADERGGIDGFTMDELAVEADVSRRTLFNYFPGKVDAVMGPELSIPADAMDRFVGGGPTGDLVEDLQDIVLAILHNEQVEAESLARFDRLMHANPVLLATMKQRMHRLAERIVEAATQRVGEPVSPRDAKVAVAVLAGLADASITEYLENPESDFAGIYVASITSARRLFG